MGAGTPLEDEWKMLSIELGTNDLAVSCYNGYGLADFTRRMREGLQMLKTNFKKLHVNLLDVYDLKSNIPQRISLLLTPGYQKKFANASFDIHDYECYCCQKGIKDKVEILANSFLFNSVLRKLAKEFTDTRGDATFTVTHQPFGMMPAPLDASCIRHVTAAHHTKGNRIANL